MIVYRIGGRIALAALVGGLILTCPPARPAAAQETDVPAAAAKAGLEEIVVTARRREERLQTVPIAITAFTQADLD